MSSLRLISINIEGHNHLSRVIPFLEREKPDIVCLQEVFQVDLSVIFRNLPGAVNFAPNGILSDPDYHHMLPLGEIGNVVYTNLPAKLAKIEYYRGRRQTIPKLRTGEPNYTNRSVIRVPIFFNKRWVSVACTHFTWSERGDVTAEQEHDLDNLLALLPETEPLVLCGDFNTPRPSSVYQILTKRFVDRVPQDVTTTIDPNLHKAGALELTVDYVFTTTDIQAEVQVISGISDHQALMATLYV